MKPTLLVVDDDRDFIDAASSIIPKRAGYPKFSAVNGASA